ncbi:carbohydrate ABC transporter permease [Schaalia naturae]|jgi:multiple sugar transport system permease protein|uniref:Carbohydrate ABC transporter permease n=1 Tax=Schaalia naturae TaxID=635203 RepID=A0ABW2SP44_9ACTO
MSQVHAPAGWRQGGAHRLWMGLLSVAMIFVAIVMIFPLIWMVLTAFKTNADAASGTPTLFPRELTVQNFLDIWSAIPFGQLYVNTIIFAGAVTIFSLAFDTMTGYALARYHFKGRNAVFIGIIVLMLVPYPSVLIPLFEETVKLGVDHTLIGMIMPRMSNAFGIFFMRQFFLSLPKDLEEAARIDGASEMGVFTRIMLPLTKPAILTLGLFHFQYNWNDLLWPLVMSTDMSGATLPAGLQMFTGQHVVQYGLLMAGSVLALLPLIVFFLAIQKTFVQGIATTGMKS